MTDLDSTYWQNRYLQNQTGWDAGDITTPLKTYFDQLEQKDLRILIPGAGNAYEAEYLHRQGFKNVFVIDIAPAPIQNILERCPEFPREHLILGDFFEHHGRYDLIVEQTFFCALNPVERQHYADHMAALLTPGGKIAGLLFDRHFEGGPPFGGTAAEYKGYFDRLFRFRVFEPCYNSIPPRAGTELFILLEKL